MELFLAQNHPPMTHLPIAVSMLAALAAIAALFIKRKELVWAWSMLSIIAILAVIPTILTGVQAGKGRKFIEHGVFVSDTPDNATILWHQRLGISGAFVAVGFVVLGVRQLRGKNVHPVLAAAVATSLAIIWGVTGHLGGKESWGPDTFPAFDSSTEQHAPAEK
jgi:hypothetical protein